MISTVKKIRKLTNKKVQLILTNKPKLIYVDPAKLVVKGNIIWSNNPNDLSVQVASPSSFKICTVHLFSLLYFELSFLGQILCANYFAGKITMYSRVMLGHLAAEYVWVSIA